MKAKKASYRPGRRGTTTLVTSAKKSTKANRMVTRTCTNGTGLSSSKLCRFTVYKSGKVKVRTKGLPERGGHGQHRGRPEVRAGPTYGPSPTWTRTWRVQVAPRAVPVLAQVGTGTAALWDNGGLSGGHPDPSSPTDRPDPCKTHFPTS